VGNKVAVKEIFPEAAEPQTRDQLGAIIGVSGTTITLGDLDVGGDNLDNQKLKWHGETEQRCPIS
jgi:hypothetical protein